MRIHADWTKDPKDYYEYGCYLIAKRPRNFYTDGQEGERYIEKAAEMGYADAMWELGSLYAPGFTQEELQKSSSWYHRAAAAGHQLSMMELENAYRFGRLGLPVDEAKADYWHRRFEEQGIKDADRDLEPWLAKAEQGDVKAMIVVASRHEERGEAYWPSAVSWYQKAAEGGSADACETLGYAYRKGWMGLRTDPKKSDYWFEKGKHVAEVQKP